jgi:Ni/Fe-hydrogenase subunit HybB-like protein
MLIAETKVHPLWHTALLPLLFLVSCLSMGYGAVVALVNVLNLTWHAKADQKLFAGMSKVNAGLLFLYAGVRLADLAWNGKLHLLARADFFAALFLFEMALFLVPAVLFLMPSVRANRGKTFGAAVLALGAGALYRIDTYISVYRPAPGWIYFPSLGELVVTLGMAALGVVLFILVSRLFPVVVVEEAARPAPARPPLRAVGGGPTLPARRTATR